MAGGARTAIYCHVVLADGGIREVQVSRRLVHAALFPHIFVTQRQARRVVNHAAGRRLQARRCRRRFRVSSGGFVGSRWGP